MSQQPKSPVPLAGCSILVIEDEYFLADDIVRELTRLGARIVGPIAAVEEATSVVDGIVAIDAAVVDINLREETAFPLVRLLRARNVPLVFTTGYDRASIEAEFQDVPLWGKPLDIPAMARELAAMIKGA
jgi:CheY-like chemotaxis protein